LGRGYATAWSPDGTRVAYVSHEPALKTYNLATGEMMTLLDEPSLRKALHLTPTVSSVSGRSFDVAWSPTGEWIALGATRSRKAGSEETLTMLVGEGSYRVLASGGGGLSDLSWSPDGRWLTMLTFAGGQFNSVVSNVEGESLFDGEGALVSWSPGGRHLVVAQGSLPLRVLTVASGEWQIVEVPGVCWPLMWNPGTAHDELTKAPTGLSSTGCEESSIQAGPPFRFRP
jgi:Tol biopolymer transport system component